MGIHAPSMMHDKVDKLYSREAMESGDGFNKAQVGWSMGEQVLLADRLWNPSYASPSEAGDPQLGRGGTTLDVALPLA